MYYHFQRIWTILIDRLSTSYSITLYSPRWYYLFTTLVISSIHETVSLTSYYEWEPGHSSFRVFFSPIRLTSHLLDRNSLVYLKYAFLRVLYHKWFSLHRFLGHLYQTRDSHTHTQRKFTQYTDDTILSFLSHLLSLLTCTKDGGIPNLKLRYLSKLSFTILTNIVTNSVISTQIKEEIFNIKGTKDVLATYGKYYSLFVV